MMEKKTEAFLVHWGCIWGQWKRKWKLLGELLKYIGANGAEHGNFLVNYLSILGLYGDTGKEM